MNLFYDIKTKTKTMSHEEQLERPLYRNWVKAGLSLKYLKEGIENFIDRELQALHESFLDDTRKSVGDDKAICKQCTIANLLPCPTLGICHVRRKAGKCSYHDKNDPLKKSRICPNGICNRFFEKIQTHHRFNNPAWKNTDATKWCEEHWQIAKCFKAVSGNDNSLSVFETDCSGILNVAIHCLDCQRSLGVYINPPEDILSKIVKFRNDVLHSGSLTLTEDKLMVNIDYMMQLLQDKAKLLMDPDAQVAVGKLKQLKEENLVVTNQDVSFIRKEALIALEEKKVEAIQAIEEKRQDSISGMNQETKQDDTVQTAIREQRELLESSVLRLTSLIQNLKASQDSVEVRLNQYEETIKTESEKSQTYTSSHTCYMNVCHVSNQQTNGHKECYVRRRNELQNHLCSLYERYVKSTPLLPILGEISTSVNDVFSELLICDDLIHGPISLESVLLPHKKVERYSDVLLRSGTPCTHMYLLGDAGMGKTTWCLKMLSTWVSACRKKRQKQIDNYKITLTSDEATMSEIEIVLFVSLRHSLNDGDITTMIKHQLFEEHSALWHTALEVIATEPNKCLVILDGFDEWEKTLIYSSGAPFQHPELPSRKDLHGCPVLTTTRPWKLNSVRLAEQDIDRAVKIQGLANQDILARRLIMHLNDKIEPENSTTAESHNFKKFCSDVKMAFGMKHELKDLHFFKVPLILIFIVSMWFDEGELETSWAANFSRLIEFILNIAEGDSKSGVKGRVLDAKGLQKVKQNRTYSETLLPECIKSRTLCKQYSNLLLKLACLAFDSLFQSNLHERKLVFSEKYLQSRNISEDELEVALKIGILSQSKSVGKIQKRQSSLSFLHKTIQEYLAALHIVYLSEMGKEDALLQYKQYCSSKDSVLEMENVLVFVCGMNYKTASELSRHLAEITLKSDKHLNDLKLKCVHEVQAAHGDSHPSALFPIYTYGVSITDDVDKSYKDKLKLQSILLKTNKKHLHALTLHKLLSNVNWLPEEFYDMRQLVTLELCNVFEQSGQSRQIDLTKCTYLEKVTLSAMSNCHFSVCSSNVQNINLSNLLSCTCAVVPKLTSDAYNDSSSLAFNKEVNTVKLSGSKGCRLIVFNDISKVNTVELSECLSCEFGIHNVESLQERPESISVQSFKCVLLNKCKIEMCHNVILETLILESSDKLDIDWPLNLNSLQQSNKMLDKICVLHAKMIPSIITKYPRMIKRLSCKQWSRDAWHSLSGVLPYMIRLQTLHLKHYTVCLLPYVIQELGCLIQLKDLKCSELSSSTWQTFAESLPSLTRLEKLTLFDHGPRYLPPATITSLCLLQNIKYLECGDFSTSTWQALGQSFIHLRKLVILKLLDSKIDGLPPFLMGLIKYIGNLKRLTCKTISKAALTELRNALSFLPHLEKFKLSRVIDNLRHEDVENFIDTVSRTNLTLVIEDVTPVEISEITV